VAFAVVCGRQGVYRTWTSARTLDVMRWSSAPAFTGSLIAERLTATWLLAEKWLWKRPALG
jgi:hypothetical protein